MSTPKLPTATILGYPRLGRRRELKRAIEKFWKGDIAETQLQVIASELRAFTREHLVAEGLTTNGAAIPESFSWYDQVLDAGYAVGATSPRFSGVGRSDLEKYFALARGTDELQPLEMTKWFDTNYHYSVPEISPDTAFAVNATQLVTQLNEAREQAVETRPTLVGPVTLLALAKAADDAPEGFEPLDKLNELIPVYRQLLTELSAAGATWVQLDEPAIVSDSLRLPRRTLVELVLTTYRQLGEQPDRPAILLTAPYGNSSKALLELAALPIEAVHADLVRGSLPEGVIEDGTLGDALGDTQFVAGVIDGRNIWRTNLRAQFTQLQALQASGVDVVVGTSVSLQHVPHDVREETKLDSRLVSWLAFADQKVQQAALLAGGLTSGGPSIEDALLENDRVLADRESAPGVHRAPVQERRARVTEADRQRASEAQRREAQRVLGLPTLATTTIGSFPQTNEIRRARSAFGRGEINADAYTEFLRAEIRRVIELQEEIGLDVLVHGEAERNDMVQYFAENLDGFAVTEHGWVQSYGTRATRPSILWGDVSRPAPITVDWITYAQSLTETPVKGMLTGPVTILAWSFVRDDQPLNETAEQVALALRDEITDLHAAGIGIVQVDEPALRELLPLDKDRQPEYLNWSVGAFRLATGGAEAQLQIHTHLCYSEFGEIIDAVDGLDADVTSIEAARSRMDVVEPLGETGYSRGIGPGVYDIHSPRVPSVDEVTELVRIASGQIPAEQLWVNPDCGLKTRGYDETVASLKNLVSGARKVRAEVQ